MNFLISILLAVLIVISVGPTLSYIVARYEKKCFEKLKDERNISLEEAISKVKSGDGWLLTYDDYKLWIDEIFWLRTDLPPDHYFALEELVRTKAYYVVRQNSFQDALEQIDKFTKERFCVCHCLELRNPDEERLLNLSKTCCISKRNEMNHSERNIKAKIANIFNLSDGRTIFFIEAGETPSFRNIDCHLFVNNDCHCQFKIYREIMSKMPDNPNFIVVATHDNVDIDLETINNNDCYLVFSLECSRHLQ